MLIAYSKNGSTLAGVGQQRITESRGDLQLFFLMLQAVIGCFFFNRFQLLDIN